MVAMITDQSLMLPNTAPLWLLTWSYHALGHIRRSSSGHEGTVVELLLGGGRQGGQQCFFSRSLISRFFFFSSTLGPCWRMSFTDSLFQNGLERGQKRIGDSSQALVRRVSPLHRRGLLSKSNSAHLIVSWFSGKDRFQKMIQPLLLICRSGSWIELDQRGTNKQTVNTIKTCKFRESEQDANQSWQSRPLLPSWHPQQQTLLTELCFLEKEEKEERPAGSSQTLALKVWRSPDSDNKLQ